MPYARVLVLLVVAPALYIEAAYTSDGTFELDTSSTHGLLFAGLSSLAALTAMRLTFGPILLRWRMRHARQRIPVEVSVEGAPPGSGLLESIVQLPERLFARDIAPELGRSERPTARQPVLRLRAADGRTWRVRPRRGGKTFSFFNVSAEGAFDSDPLPAWLWGMGGNPWLVPPPPMTRQRSVPGQLLLPRWTWRKGLVLHRTQTGKRVPMRRYVEPLTHVVKGELLEFGSDPGLCIGFYLGRPPRESEPLPRWEQRPGELMRSELTETAPAGVKELAGSGSTVGGRRLGDQGVRWMIGLVTALVAAGASWWITLVASRNPPWSWLHEKAGDAGGFAFWMMSWYFLVVILGTLLQAPLARRRGADVRRGVYWAGQIVLYGVLVAAIYHVAALRLGSLPPATAYARRTSPHGAYGASLFFMLAGPSLAVLSGSIFPPRHTGARRRAPLADHVGEAAAETWRQSVFASKEPGDAGTSPATHPLVYALVFGVAGLVLLAVYLLLSLR